MVFGEKVMERKKGGIKMGWKYIIKIQEGIERN